MNVQIRKPDIDNVVDSILCEIRAFKLNHFGQAPEKIFVSTGLNCFLMRENKNYIVTSLNAESLAGIPLQPYPEENVEYYLAEKRGKFWGADFNE